VNTVTSTITVADYVAAMQRKEITVNADYQRSPKVWPPAAKSFLIETILLNYPMPKLSLHQITDVKSRTTKKEIVDGQQRSMTILDFWEDKLRLSRNLSAPDVAGKTFSEIHEDFKAVFVSYAISYDLFVNADDEEIRETFRRINSYTVALNEEERRHSRFQGDFKWFIHALSRRYSPQLQLLGILSVKQLNRMAETKLFTEIIHALLNGIMTTKGKELNTLYEKFDKSYPQEKDHETKIAYAMKQIAGLKSIQGTALMKPYQVYALALAIIHLKTPVAVLGEVSGTKGKKRASTDEAEENLSLLAAALEEAEEPKKFGDFWRASDSKTNVGTQRQIRFEWLYRAFFVNFAR